MLRLLNNDSMGKSLKSPSLVGISQRRNAFLQGRSTLYSCLFDRLGRLTFVRYNRLIQFQIAQRPAGSLSRPQATFVTRPTHAVTHTSRSSATGSIDNFPGRIFLH